MVIILRMRNFQNEVNYWQISWCCRFILHLFQSRHFANFSVAIMTLFEITNYHWPIYWMIRLMLFVRLSSPYSFWRRVIPYTWFRQRAHGWCHQSSEDAYFSAAPDPTFAFVGVPCCPALDFVFAFWIMITFYTMLMSLFCVTKCRTLDMLCASREMCCSPAGLSDLLRLRGLGGRSSTGGMHRDVACSIWWRFVCLSRRPWPTEDKRTGYWGYVERITTHIVIGNKGLSITVE
jgi:hypothetical protein